MDNLLITAAETLRKAALNEDAKDFILNNETLYKTLKKAANRYIGGENLEETIIKAIEQNNAGFKCSIEFMGESTRTIPEANAATREFIRICDEIKNHNLKSAVSLDLSHIGLAISRDLCFDNLALICSVASKNNIDVIISAEGTERTDTIHEIYTDALKTYKNLGITLQAYLYRTGDDFKELIKKDGKIRMVKGAFETAKGLSMPRGPQLDEVYIDYVDQLLQNNHSCSIATHHHQIQQETKRLITKYNTDKSLYEFESLYGIQIAQLAALKEDGHPSKLYFAYGKEWYLYLCNRIAEHPLSLFTALNDIVSAG
jgi:proline dehydrogenase